LYRLVRAAIVATTGDEMRLRTRALGTLVVAVGCVVAGCGPRHSVHAVIGVDAPVALADRPVHLTVSGLVPDDTVEVSAAARDGLGTQWRSRAVFRADGRGTVDLDQARPRSGTYTGVDGMGLFWSMVPPTGDPDATSFRPSLPRRQPSYGVQIIVTAHGRRLAARTLNRAWLASGVTDRTLTPAADKVDGELFLPPPGHGRHAAVLLFGGSEGGNSGVYEAALLASHGFPALSLAYFGEPGLPATLRNIPLSYFARAARLLAGEPGADPAHLVVQGYSRGSEAALLLGQYDPGLIHGVIVYSPSSMANAGLPGGVAWTMGGRPVQEGTIPLDHVDGPVLAIAGQQDVLWASAPSARQIMTELDLDHDRFPHQALTFPEAGHGVGTFPYVPAGVRATNPVIGQVLQLGGTRAGNAAAKAQGWPKTLAFLTALGG
jgi:dienelactone hydrolase